MNLNKIAIVSQIPIVNTYKNLKHKVLECNMIVYFNFCDKGVWWCSWWTETCSTLLYSMKVLCLMVYFVCISRMFHIYKLAKQMVLRKECFNASSHNSETQVFDQRRLYVSVVKLFNNNNNIY